jgi:hypothetical protein
MLTTRYPLLATVTASAVLLGAIALIIHGETRPGSEVRGQKSNPAPPRGVSGSHLSVER